MLQAKGHLLLFLNLSTLKFKFKIRGSTDYVESQLLNNTQHSK